MLLSLGGIRFDALKLNVFSSHLKRMWGIFSNTEITYTACWRIPFPVLNSSNVYPWLLNQLSGKNAIAHNIQKNLIFIFKIANIPKFNIQSSRRSHLLFHLCYTFSSNFLGFLLDLFKIAVLMFCHILYLLLFL